MRSVEAEIIVAWRKLKREGWRGIYPKIVVANSLPQEILSLDDPIVRKMAEFPNNLYIKLTSYKMFNMSRKML